MSDDDLLKRIKALRDEEEPPTQKVTPAYGTDMSTALKKAVAKQHQVLEEPPNSTTAIFENRIPVGPMMWWQRETGVAKVLAAIGTLVGVCYAAAATYRATAPLPPPPPPPSDIICPLMTDEKTPRNNLCMSVWDFQKSIASLWSKEQARSQREADVETMKRLEEESKPKKRK